MRAFERVSLVEKTDHNEGREGATARWICIQVSILILPTWEKKSQRQGALTVAFYFTEFRCMQSCHAISAKHSLLSIANSSTDR